MCQGWPGLCETGTPSAGPSLAVAAPSMLQGARKAPRALGCATLPCPRRNLQPQHLRGEHEVPRGRRQPFQPGRAPPPGLHPRKRVPEARTTRLRARPLPEAPPAAGLLQVRAARALCAWHTQQDRKPRLCEPGWSLARATSDSQTGGVDLQAEGQGLAGLPRRHSHCPHHSTPTRNPPSGGLGTASAICSTGQLCWDALPCAAPPQSRQRRWAPPPSVPPSDRSSALSAPPRSPSSCSSILCSFFEPAVAPLPTLLWRRCWRSRCRRRCSCACCCSAASRASSAASSAKGTSMPLHSGSTEQIRV